MCSLHVIVDDTSFLLATTNAIEFRLVSIYTTNVFIS